MRGRSSPFRDTRGSTVVEFAMVLPIVIFFLLGIVDAGRLMWTLNRAEKGTQFAVRYAAVTAVVPPNLATRDFALSDNVNGGDAVPISVLDTITCTSSSTSYPASSVACSCSGNCPSNITDNASVTAFNNIVQRVRWTWKEVTPNRVAVEYRNVGLGFAGDPNGPDVAPLITVTVSGVTFNPMVFEFFGASLALPAVRASLTMEDGAGTVSN
jgi:Flp pilus assembly protein TadG